MNTTHLDQFTRAYIGNGATITGKCPHCGNVEQFHGMDMRPQFFDECKPFCGNCAEFYLLKDNIGDDGQVHGPPLTARHAGEGRSEVNKTQAAQYVEIVNGTIIGDIYSIGQLFYEGRSQGPRFYGSHAEIREQAIAASKGMKAFLGDEYKRLYPKGLELRIWD